MRTYTGFAIPNTPMAERYISENTDMVPGYGFLLRPELGLTPHRTGVSIATLAESFMASHPRGKGTSGDETKRRFYAACHAIKAKQSRARYYRRDDDRLRAANKLLTKGQYEALMHFPDDGTFLYYPTRNGKKIDSRIIDKLVELGFLTGMFVVEGADTDNPKTVPAEMWLTDLGIKARAIVHTIRERARKQKVADGITGSTPMLVLCEKLQIQYWTAEIDIDGETPIIVRRPANQFSKADVEALRDKLIALLQADARA
jgi:hypothetical protein